MAQKYTTEQTEYKGNKLIVIKAGDDDRFPFQFGLGKAKKILACIEDIQEFVDENDKPKKKDDEPKKKKKKDADDDVPDMTDDDDKPKKKKKKHRDDDED